MKKYPNKIGNLYFIRIAGDLNLRSGQRSG
jgi:hypothetical protein